MPVTVDFDPLDQAVELSAEDFHLTVRAQASELLQLSRIDSADWSTRRSLRVGTTLGHPVFWAREQGDAVRVLIGADDESWEIALTISTAEVARLVALAATPPP